MHTVYVDSDFNVGRTIGWSVAGAISLVAIGYLVTGLPGSNHVDDATLAGAVITSCRNAVLQELPARAQEFQSAADALVVKQGRTLTVTSFVDGRTNTGDEARWQWSCSAVFSDAGSIDQAKVLSLSRD